MWRMYCRMRLTKPGSRKISPSEQHFTAATFWSVLLELELYQMVSEAPQRSSLPIHSMTRRALENTNGQEGLVFPLLLVQSSNATMHRARSRIQATQARPSLTHPSLTALYPDATQPTALACLPTCSSSDPATSYSAPLQRNSRPQASACFPSPQTAPTEPEEQIRRSPAHMTGT